MYTFSGFKGGSCKSSSGPGIRAFPTARCVCHLVFVRGMDSVLYSAISVSILARILFMYLLYKNKSANTYSLLFCLMNIGSSGMWMYYSIVHDDSRLFVRSTSEMSLLVLSSIYIVRNKVKSSSMLSVLPQ